MKRIMVMLVLMANAGRFAAGMADMPQEEVSKVKAFLSDFRDACNSQDLERVKKIAGGIWSQLSHSIMRAEKLGEIEVLNITTEGETNVTTRTTIQRGEGRGTYSQEVVFTLSKDRDGYTIDRVSVPAVEQRNKEIWDGIKVLEKLDIAIRHRSMDEVRELLSFGLSEEFDAELSKRGLSWIRDAVEGGVAVSFAGSGVRRERSSLVGLRIMTLDAATATNVERKVVFSGMKIDRAAPPKETKEEFRRRFRAEQEAVRRQFEKLHEVDGGRE